MKLFIGVFVLLFSLYVVKSFDLEDLFKDAEGSIYDRIKAEVKTALKPHKKRDPASSKLSSFLDSTPYIKTVGYNALKQLRLLKNYKKRSGLFGTDLWKNLSKVFPDRTLFDFCPGSKMFSDHFLPPPKIHGRRCCPLPDIQCRKNRFRTIDGSCNCPSNPHMGRSNRAYSRLVPADYADGIEEPRTGKFNLPLPSSRKVSNVIYESMADKLSGVLTVFHMTIGQMIDHDTDRTPISKFLLPNGTMVDIECGHDECQTSAPEDKECFPIPVPKDDPCFRNSCLKFVRSQAFVKDKCEIGPREQPNVLSSWLDVSFMYGSTIEELEPIREISSTRGRMKILENPIAPHCRPLIPTKYDKACRDVNATIQCFYTGDARQNEQSGVSVIHITFVRLHNYFEKQLHRLNPHWDGERLFQETRRIVIAVYQNMVYAEYLPPILGPELMKQFGLNIERKKCIKDFDCVNFNADVSNSFAAAAFRFGHSQITDIMRLTNAAFTEKIDLPFSSVFFRPRIIYETHFNGTTCGVDAVLLGHASQKTDKADRFFSKQVTKHMFTDDPPHGLGTDLPGFSTQRGRDHGIPGYGAFREFCGLSVPTSFDNMEDIPPKIQRKFKKLYRHVEDIDLFAAGMTERHIYGGIVGPTFACMLAKTFQSLKRADKFWFENCGKNGFTKDQLENIREYTFGRFYCDTLDKVETIQPFPSMLSAKEARENLGINRRELLRRMPIYRKSNNERVPCSKLKGVNFNLWKTKN